MWMSKWCWQITLQLYELGIILHSKMWKLRVRHWGIYLWSYNKYQYMSQEVSPLFFLRKPLFILLHQCFILGFIFKSWIITHWCVSKSITWTITSIICKGNKMQRKDSNRKCQNSSHTIKIRAGRTCWVLILRFQIPTWLRLDVVIQTKHIWNIEYLLCARHYSGCLEQKDTYD